MGISVIISVGISVIDIGLNSVVCEQSFTAIGDSYGCLSSLIGECLSLKGGIFLEHIKYKKITTPKCWI